MIKSFSGWLWAFPDESLSD
jgi:hypothetical protein